MPSVNIVFSSGACLSLCWKSFWKAETFHFHEAQFTSHCMDHSFGLMPQKPMPNPPRFFFLTLFSRIAIVLSLTIWSLIHFVIFVSTICLCLESVFHNAHLFQYHLLMRMFFTFIRRPFVSHVLCPPDIIQMAKTYSWIKTYT